jgi:hypothetical protein
MKNPKNKNMTIEPKKFTTKSFHTLMKKRLTTSEIAEIELQTMLEVTALKPLQNDITTAKVLDFMPTLKSKP